jgi:hypothetical protein
MDEAGFLRSASGREVSAGTAVSLLKDGDADHPIGPSGFRRGPLTEGHQALSTAPAGIVDGPAQARVARTGPAGPVGPAGSGTADRSMADAEDDDGTRLVPGDDDDDSGVGLPDGEMAKGLVPQQFMRGYLAAGHQANSPAVTGRQGTTAIPSSDPIEHRDFTGGYLTAGHADPSPDDAPGANNPHYRVAAERYNANQQQVRAEHVVPSESIVSQPSASRVALPQDMMASAVPQAVQVMATRPSPGEGQ